MVMFKCIRSTILNRSLNRHQWLSSSGLRTVLGIETSCDDTAAAIVDEKGNVLSESSHSQLEFHLSNGGVVPPVARDLHNKHLDGVVYDTIQKSGLEMKDITCVAVTNRPGLPLSLEVGVTYAKRLAIKYGKPLIPIHHMEAHALMGMFYDRSLTFPFLALLISGGHSQLAFVKDLEEWYLLGECIDCAPGEVMDKVSRRLKVRNMGHPFDKISGGEAIEILAKKGNPRAYFTADTSVPLNRYRDCNFSFSGYKNIIRAIDKLENMFGEDYPPDQPLSQAPDVAASLLHSMTIHILKRLHRALVFIEKTDIMNADDVKESVASSLTIDYTNRNPQNRVIPVVVSGGVACNDFITERVSKMCRKYEGIFQDTEVRAVIPRPKKLCSDNGIMIGWNGILKLLAEDEKRSSGVLRPQKDIESLDVKHREPLGIDIKHLVIKADIKNATIKSDILT